MGAAHFQPAINPRTAYRPRGNSDSKKLIKNKYNYSKYRFKCLLTKDPSETSSLEYE